jgi:hypothetical protein
VHRLSRDVTQLLLHKALLPAREIEEAAEWMVGTIVKRAGTSKAKIEAIGRERNLAVRAPSPLV